MLKLRLLTGPRAGRQLRVSDTKPVSVGRRVGRLRLHDSRVSKRHAEVIFSNGVWLLKDLGSSNGSYVNHGRVNGMVELETGDLIQMGRVLIKVLRADDIGMDTSLVMPDDELAIQDDIEFLADGMRPSSIMSEAAAPTDVPEQIDLDEVDLDLLLSSDDKDSVEGSSVSDFDHLLADPEPIQAPVDETPGPKGQEPIEAAHGGDELITSEDKDESVAAVEVQAEQAGEAGDPAEETTSDLITLDDDDHALREPQSGTTLAAEVDAFEATEEEDDAESPEVVGLALGDHPPQQPDAPESIEVDADDEVAEFSEAEVPKALQGEIGDEPESGLEPEPKEKAEEEVVTADANDALVLNEREMEPEPGQSDQEPAEVHGSSNLLAAQIDDHGDEEPEFDIDAAFAAISEGLDDSFELPAIEISGAPNPDEVGEKSKDDVVIDDEAQDVNRDVEQPVEARPEQSDALVNSQLDIGFIQDALAKLDDDSPDVEEKSLAPMDETSEDAAADSDEDRFEIGPEEELDGVANVFESAEGASVETASVAEALAEDLAQAQEPASEGEPAASQSDFVPSPPPGINPSSVLASEESGRKKSKPNHKKGKYFSWVLAVVSVFVGGWLAYSSLIAPRIAGRAGEASRMPLGHTGTSQAPATSGATPDAPGSTVRGSTTADSVFALPERAATSQNPARQKTPNPFAEGPAVIGAGALEGIGVDAAKAGAQQPDPAAVTQDPALTLPQPPAPSASAPSVVTPGTGTTAAEPGVTPPAAPKKPGRIVFLVDASGSLVDTMPQMLAWLQRAVKTVGPDEHFAVIFFKAGRAIEASPPGMLKPTRTTLTVLNEQWLDPAASPVMPAGRSDPTIALIKAVSYKPTDIYLLSDESFAQRSGKTTADEAAQIVTDALGDAEVRLHGVQFFYRNGAGVLESLANEFDGTYEFVKEEVTDGDTTIDLIEELRDR